MNFSLAYTGTIVLVLGFIFKLTGVDFDEGKITEVINGVVELVGALLSAYGRFRLGGVKWFGARE